MWTDQRCVDPQQHADGGNIEENVVFEKVETKDDIPVEKKYAVAPATLECVRKTKTIVKEYIVYGSSRSADQAIYGRRLDGLHDEQQCARMTGARSGHVQELVIK
eukprot:2518167-Heterocapsa_arctica.AAC.1